MGPSLDQGPNVVLLRAGTNDLLPDDSSPDAAATVLGTMIDQRFAALPDTVSLVAQIINRDDSASHPGSQDRTVAYQNLIPSLVQDRYYQGRKILTVDFRSISGVCSAVKMSN